MQVYNLRGGWKPEYTFNLSKGEALFIPPAMIHETKNVGRDCAASITYQYSDPMAAGLFRSFWPTLRRTTDIYECWVRASMWATLGHQDMGPNEIFNSADANKNG